MKAIKDGFLTGMTLQLAVGPVFFYILNVSISDGIANGFVSVAAAALGDATYITLAILGLGKILERNKIRTVFAYVSAVVLIFFGWMILESAVSGAITLSSDNNPDSLIGTFAKVYLLTISNPITIIFFTGLFSAKMIEKSYSKSQLRLFGFGTITATLLFMSANVIVANTLSAYISEVLVRVLNGTVGTILILYGVKRLYHTLFSTNDSAQDETVGISEQEELSEVPPSS